MTDAERQVLQDAHAACLAGAEANRASAEAIAAVLAGSARAEKPVVARDEFVSLKTAAAAWGIQDDSARKKLRRLMRKHPHWVIKRGGTRWEVHRDALW